MHKTIDLIIVWSEVWALLIPLFILSFYKVKTNATIRPIVIYVYAAFVLNLVANLISSQKRLGFSLPWHNNIIVYNLHAILRLILFAWFFWILEPEFIKASKFRFVLFSLLTIALGMAIYESFTGKAINSYSYSIGVSLLLFFCLKFYFFYFRSGQLLFTRQPAFWIVTGLGIFVVVSFPIYLFYKMALVSDPAMARNMWRWQNIAFLILCIFLAIGLYLSTYQKVYRNE